MVYILPLLPVNYNISAQIEKFSNLKAWAEAEALKVENLLSRV